MPLNQSSPWHLGHQSMTLLVDMKWDRGRRKRSPCKEEARGNSWWSLRTWGSLWETRQLQNMSFKKIFTPLLLPHSVLSVHLTSDTVPSHCFKLFPWLPNKRNWHNFLLYWNKLLNSCIKRVLFSCAWRHLVPSWDKMQLLKRFWDCFRVPTTKFYAFTHKLISICPRGTGTL